MIYLNIKTITLRAPEYVGCDPTQRATWLNLLAHCCEQENGGRIEGCGEWKDRQWQQTLGVTLEEVRQDCGLWKWDGNSIQIAFYPLDREQEVVAKRDAGKRGGMVRSEVKTQASRDNGAKHQPKQNPSTTQAEPKLEPNKKERNEKEWKGMEGGTMQKVEQTPALSEFLEEAKKIGVEAEVATEIWHDNESRPITPYGQWTDYRGNPIAKWQANMMARASQIRSRRGNGTGKINGHSKPEGVWSLQQRIEAAQKEVERIQSNPSNKVQVEDSFDRVLRPEHLAKVKALKASISEMRQRMAGVEVAA
jgi:hypothetical protein